MGLATKARRRDVSNDSIVDLKQRLLNKLTSRVRTEHQLRQWALLAGYEAQLVDAALVDLRRAQVIDDLAYANALVRSKADLAAPELRRRLFAAGVSEQQVSIALQERAGDDQQACDRVVAKLWPRMSKLPFEVAQRRVLNQLKRRGYEFSVAMRSLERVAGDR